MRRSARLGLILVPALLVVIAGVYSAYWFYVAGRIEHGLAAWAQSSRADKLDVSWQKMRVAGFPAVFRVEIAAAHLRDGARVPSPELHVAFLSGTARPWNFTNWRLTASNGFAVDLIAPGEKVPATLIAQKADGVVWIPAEEGWNLWLRVRDTSFEAAAAARVGSADAWIEAPSRPQGHVEAKMAIAVAAHQVGLPTGLGPLGAELDELDFAATIQGALPNGRLADALATWRDKGGAIELNRLRLRWDGLAATASGTLALNEELQPTAALSGGVQGYDAILTALVDGGRMRASDAGLARIALSLLAKAGPDGKPEIKTSFTIQNGQVFLGPARLGKLPRLSWE